MRMHKTRAALATGAALVTGLSLVLSGVAQADSGARPGDVVGIGSDTIQNIGDFVFDSAPGNTGGYNELGNKNRVDNVFATGDANGRAVYDGTCGTAPGGGSGLGALCSTTTNQAPNLLPGSVILRDGSAPVTRPNGSGAGVAALNLDASGAAGYKGLPTGSIQYTRMSRLPTTAEEANCSTSGGCGGLDVFQIATDQLQIAVQNAAFGGTDAPSALSDQELLAIYTCTGGHGGTSQGDLQWGDLAGYTGSAPTAFIDPLIPQSGSGTRTFFLNELASVNGGTAPTPGPCVRTVEEHDPTGIYGDPSPKDAIEPFSAGKLALINGTATGLSSPYFANGAGYAGTVGGQPTPDGAYTPGYLTTLTGANGPDGHAGFNVTGRPMYIVIRHGDENSTTPVQPGSSQNWAEAFFTGGTIANHSAPVQPLIESGAAGLLIEEAGFTPSYKACPLNPNPASC
jgi:ABC-type phosphate transport system substrate-binding protein